MPRFTKIALTFAATLLGACAGYLAVQKFFDRAPAPVELRDWRTRQLAGLILEAPGELQNSPLDLGPAQEFVENSEMQVFKTMDFEIDVLRTIYKDGTELNFDGAVQGAVDGIARLGGVRNLRQTVTELTVSGQAARRVSVTAGRWSKTLRVEMLLIADGQTYYQVQAIFASTTPGAVAAAERLLQSVQLAP